MKLPVLFSVLMFLAMSIPIFAKNNATFYMKDGTKKEAEFVGMENNVVTVRIIMPDSSVVTKTFPKEKFDKIEKYDWEQIDLSLSDFPAKKSNNMAAPAIKDSVKNSAPAPLEPTPLHKDTVAIVQPPEIVKDTIANVHSSESNENDKIATLIEAGNYERKSISFINSLWCLDGSVKNIPSADLKYALNKINEKLKMSRFDYNPLPQKLIDDFTSEANAAGDFSPDKLPDILEKTLLPKIIEIVDFYKEARAKSYTSETERNSFFTNKAKGYGFTMSELARVMNSAYIYVPFIGDYKTISKDGRTIISMNAGILWYHISIKSGKAKAVLVVKKETMSFGAGREGNKIPYMCDGKVCTPQEFAFRSCVKNAAGNLLVATQAMPEFRLSGQVLEKDGGKVGFDLGKKEGLVIDDKYNIAEFEELDDGTIKQINSGWASVSFVADSSSMEGYKSKAKICAGDPSIGAVLSEYPRIPIDITFKAKMFPGIGKDDCQNKELSLIGFGGQVDARYNVGRMMGVSQLFLGIGFGLGASGVTDSLYKSLGAASVTHYNLDGIIMKRFILGDCIFGLEGGITHQNASMSFKISGDPVEEDFSGLGFFCGINLGICFSPCLQLDLGADYESVQLNGVFKVPNSNLINVNDKYKGTMSGPQISIGLTWSPPALPFDPLDMFRGMSGM